MLTRGMVAAAVLLAGATIVATHHGQHPPDDQQAARSPETAAEAPAPSTVTVVAAGRRRTVVTSRTSPRRVAAAAGVRTDPEDRVFVQTPVPATAPARTETFDLVRVLSRPTVGLPPATVVRVVDVKVKKRRRVQDLAPALLEEPDPRMPAGENRVLDEGAPTRVVYRVKVIRHDGVMVTRKKKVVSRTPGAPRRVAVGTGPPATGDAETSPWPVVAGAADRNWTALAACESSGNPTVVSSSGKYHGLYQFDASTWRSVGGTGVASAAPAAEQTYRAQLLFASRGAAPWPSCGRLL